MNRTEKQESVATLSEYFQGSASAFVVDYKGCKCRSLESLRAKLREGGSKFAVVKNTLAKRALAEAELDSISGLFTGPVGVVWGGEDPVATAKVLKEFGADVETFEVKGGVLDGDVLSAKQVEALSALPSKEQLLGQLLSVINAPATRLAQTLNAPAAQFVRLLEAWRGKKEEES